MNFKKYNAHSNSTPNGSEKRVFLLALAMPIFLWLAFFGQAVSAAVMQSGSYKIQSDSVNIGGGDSTSASYKVQSTVGELATGDSLSANYKMKAGYQQMQGSSLSLVPAADITMSRPLSITENTAVGSTTWTVITDNPAGYTLSISASSTSPCPLNALSTVRKALCDMSTQKGFTDMATTSKALWLVSGDYVFGYSAIGTNTTGHGTDAGNDCIGTAHTPNTTTLLWQGFNGTTPIQIASSTTGTGALGVGTILCVAVEQQNIFAPSGAYTATTTATVIAL